MTWVSHWGTASQLVLCDWWWQRLLLHNQIFMCTDLFVSCDFRNDSGSFDMAVFGVDVTPVVKLGERRCRPFVCDQCELWC